MQVGVGIFYRRRNRSLIDIRKSDEQRLRKGRGARGEGESELDYVARHVHSVHIFCSVGAKTPGFSLGSILKNWRLVEALQKTDPLPGGKIDRNGNSKLNCNLLPLCRFSYVSICRWLGRVEAGFPAFWRERGERVDNAPSVAASALRLRVGLRRRFHRRRSWRATPAQAVSRGYTAPAPMQVAKASWSCSRCQ